MAIKKIALITDGMWPYSLGGMQKHSFFMCKYLALRKIYIDVYYTNHQKIEMTELKPYFKADNIAEYIRLFFIPNVSARHFPGHYLYETYQNSKAVNVELNKRYNEYDIIYIQGFLGWRFLTSIKAGEMHPPVVLNMHGLNMFQRTSDLRSRMEQFFFKPVALRLLKRADYVQSLGGSLTKMLINQGIRKKKILEIGIGIEHSWIIRAIKGENNIIRRFVFIGRFDRVKGIYELNGALKKLLNVAPFEFVGPISKSYQIEAKEIIYHGRLTEEKKIVEVLDNVDFLVLPSYSEGMPTVILEAMARGCAIIATNVGAVSELVSENNGILISPQSESELKYALEKAVNLTSEKLTKMKFASKELAHEFVWEKLIGKMVDKFQNLIFP